LVRRVTALNLGSGEVEKLIRVGKDPQGGIMTKDGRWIFLTNHAGNTISMIDVNKRRVTGDIKTGDGPARIPLTPDEGTLVYNLQEGEGRGLADVATGAETDRIKLCADPHISPFRTAIRSASSRCPREK
jgi:YVTN family beta-propeller protein